MGQTELDGYGRVLWLTKDVWPEFHLVCAGGA